jgi:hypothetical protein
MALAFPLTNAKAAQPQPRAANGEVSAATQAKKWTRARFDQAKQRWAQNQRRFTRCNLQLEAEKKVNRLSLRRQVRFLEDCMRRSR